ncbi:MAG: metalloregulator ArsR/SmtB family transcription factor, partial [Caldilineaceae bacterium]|nr:metalloregulator ArsR/SmtB family transcription factor [Caldilineaceae bacterium]
TLKALADANRLKMVALLAQAPRSGDELAALLDLNPSTVSHHLARLQKTGLVSATVEQYYHVYQLETEVLAEVTKLLAPDALIALVQAQPEIANDAYREQILARWIQNNRLQALPTPVKQREIVLAWLAEKFVANQRYTPQQVDDVLNRWCDWHDSRRLDIVSVTRALVDEQLLRRTRDGRWYWRVDAPPAQDIAPAQLSQADTATLHLPLPLSPLRRLTQLAMRVQANRPLSAAEVDALLIQQGVEAATVADTRAALVAEGLLVSMDDATYCRPTIDPDHPATQKLRAEALTRSPATE